MKVKGLLPVICIIQSQEADFEWFLYHSAGSCALRRMAVEIKHDLSVLINLNLTYFFCNVEEILHNTPGLHGGTERVVSDSYRLKPPHLLRVVSYGTESYAVASRNIDYRLHLRVSAIILFSMYSGTVAMTVRCVFGP